jgi:hypothetical protein
VSAEEVFARVFPRGYIAVDADDPCLAGAQWAPSRVAGVEMSRPTGCEGLMVARATVDGVTLYRMSARFHLRRGRRWLER